MADDEPIICKYCGNPLLFGQMIHGLHNVHWECYEREGGMAQLKKLRSKLSEIRDKLSDLDVPR